MSAPNPLTDCDRHLTCGSMGLRFLSHKGRGKADTSAPPFSPRGRNRRWRNDKVAERSEVG